jgi:hypothetical protein
LEEDVLRDKLQQKQDWTRRLLERLVVAMQEQSGRAEGLENALRQDGATCCSFFAYASTGEKQGVEAAILQENTRLRDESAALRAAQEDLQKRQEQLSLELNRARARLMRQDEAAEASHGQLDTLTEQLLVAQRRIDKLAKGEGTLPPRPPAPPAVAGAAPGVPGAAPGVPGAGADGAAVAAPGKPAEGENTLAARQA